MNERIKRLWEQSTGAAVPAEGFYSSASKYNIEKFAELIVQECIEQLRLVPYGSDSIEFGEEVPYQDAIKKHFGVEE